MNVNFITPLPKKFAMSAFIQSTQETFGLKLNDSRHVSLEDFLPWFEADYKLDELINEFWGINSKARLIAVTRDIQDKAWKGLISEWDTDASVTGQFRINKSLIESLLKYSLGEKELGFQLKKITNLELSIFENFFVELENFWKDYWKLSIPNSNGSFIYLIWGIETDDKQLGSLAIGVPPGIIPKKIKLKTKYDLREIAAKLDIEAPLDLVVGKTKLSYNEIRQLEGEDLIIFEESSVNYLIWEKCDIERMYINTQLPGKDNPRAKNLYYDEEIDPMNEEMNNNEDLLTDLPIELTAKFKSVYMPLSKIVELESGGILPLGLLMDSKLTLVAPGDKPIASGNLVIIGNQFGIKIDKTNIKKSSQAKLNHNFLKAPEIQVSDDRRSPTPSKTQEKIKNYDEDDDDELNQELEDIGIDPKELDQLEDLY